jgi:hypothetical protein
VNDADILLLGGIIAVVTAGIDLWNAKGRTFTPWGVMALGVTIIVAFLNQ